MLSTAPEATRARPTITVVGAGSVGGSLAQRLAERDLADIVLVDVVEGLAEGKALDLLQAGAIAGHDSLITGGTDLALSGGSEVVVITSGAARRPGMSRDELVVTNARIVSSVARLAAHHSPGCVLVVVSNPLDAMAQLARAATGFPRKRVLGMAGVLDSARFRAFVAREVGASASDVHAPVLGGHGDTMVPLTRLATVAGVPLAQLIPRDRLDAIVRRVRDAGAEIVGLLKTGSAFYAPSAAAAAMVEAILLDSRRVLPCSVLLEGEYGISGLFTGVPCRLAAGGLDAVVEIALDAAEREDLHRSAASVQALVDLIDARRSDIDPSLPPLA